LITDVNVNLSRWPFRRLPHDDPVQLVRKLRSSGITSAWTGSFDGVLHKDLSSVNRRTVKDCEIFGDGLLIPVGSINPTLPAWKDDMQRCRDEHGIQIIRLHPNYHGYKLDNPVFAELLGLAVEQNFIVQIALKMEDERVHHPLMQVEMVDATPLKELVEQHPKSKILIINGMKGLQKNRLIELAKTGNVSFEISMLEAVGGVENVLKLIPIETLFFGSYFPFFYLESALLKMQESELGNFRSNAIFNGNAKRLLAEN
jgi:predicted TIM-barrel fold metal-dependent hydrolase